MGRSNWRRTALWALLAAGCRAGDGDAGAISAVPDSGVVTVDGTALPYRTEGAGRPCLVFGSPVYYPRTFSAEFKTRFRCTHLTQRGFVASAPAPAGGYTVAVTVADLEAARLQLGLERFVLIGHSMHGTMALAYALAHPERVEAVIAIGSPPGLDRTVGPAGSRYWDEAASPGRKAAAAQRLAALSADSLARLDPGAAIVATYLANAARYWADSSYDAGWLWAGMEPNAQLIAQVMSGNYRLPAAGPERAPPALVVLGRWDFVVPPGVWDCAPAPFANLTRVVFDHSGHTPQLEEPERFQRVVSEWLDRVAPLAAK